MTGNLRFDVPFLAGRLLGATDWIAENPATERLRIGCFGSSTGGAAALTASVERLEKIGAIVCRGSRTDMAKVVLARVAAPTLLIVGERDETVLTWNRESFAELRCEKQLEIIPAATHLFEESGTLEEVARLAAEWFRRWLAPRWQIDQPTCRSVQSPTEIRAASSLSRNSARSRRTRRNDLRKKVRALSYFSSSLARARGS